MIEIITAIINNCKSTLKIKLQVFEYFTYKLMLI